MCTALSFLSGKHYFGRNLDLGYHYNEAVTVSPQDYPFAFRHSTKIHRHYAIIGIATVADGYPLYYDGTNEAGLSVAALNFPGNACYATDESKLYKIAPFELIPWILCQCKTVQDATKLLQQTQMIPETFSPDYPLTDMHWIVSDKAESITVEPLQTGLQITPNPYNVLTNNPPFDYHVKNLQNYLHLSNNIPHQGLLSPIPFTPYSNGLGAFGLPGDLSSSSRFIRAFFAQRYSFRPSEDTAAITQFFHILDFVSQTEGLVKEGSSFTKTVYTSCCETASGRYCYRTYEDAKIRCVRLTDDNRTGSRLTAYPLERNNVIRNIN